MNTYPVYGGFGKEKASTWAYIVGLSAVSLLVDFVVHVLMDVVAIALQFRAIDVLGDPDDGSGLGDGDDDLYIHLILHRTGRWR